MDSETLKSVHLIGESSFGGQIYAANEVFALVVGHNATEIKGVMGLSDLNTGELITKMTDKNLGKALRLDLGKENMSVLVGIIVLAGSNLLEVSKAVQKKVADSVENIIGVSLSAVNVQITDVRSR